jgi:hypothetical protein
MTSTQKLNSADSKQAVEEFDTEVLYQKLGDRWFAFSVINDDVFMSPVSEEKIVEIKQERAPDFGGMNGNDL